MRKGFRNWCNGDDSTSTINRQRTEQGSAFAIGSPPCLYAETLRENQPTLEEMILQLELEEKAARRAKLDQEYEEIRHRMSCVNSSDILRSARNALNQYPRFSLDGKDSMYRSSFQNNPTRLGKRFFPTTRQLPMPATIGGEDVVWCRPGIVGKLMGLDAMPIPIGRYRRGLTAAMKRQQHLRRKKDKEDEIEKARLVVDWGGNDGVGGRRGSCSRTGYCVMKPLRVDHLSDEDVGWPIRRFQ